MAATSYRYYTQFLNLPPELRLQFYRRLGRFDPNNPAHIQALQSFLAQQQSQAQAPSSSTPYSGYWNESFDRVMSLHGVPYAYATEVQDPGLSYSPGGQVMNWVMSQPLGEDAKRALSGILGLLEDRWKREAIYQNQKVQFWDWLEAQGWDRLLSRYLPGEVYTDWVSRRPGLAPEMQQNLARARDRVVDLWRGSSSQTPFADWLSRQDASRLALTAGPAELGRSVGRNRWLTY